jgi:hypothetical protein
MSASSDRRFGSGSDFTAARSANAKGRSNASCHYLLISFSSSLDPLPGLPLLIRIFALAHLEEALIAFERRLQIPHFIQNDGTQENVARLLGMQGGDAVQRSQRGRIVLGHHQHPGQFAPGLRRVGLQLGGALKLGGGFGNLR